MGIKLKKMGEIEDSKGRSMVFVTVGTTLFDALVRAVDTKEVKQELFRKGYTHLLIQMGRGFYTPTKVLLIIFIFVTFFSIFYFKSKKFILITC